MMVLLNRVENQTWGQDPRLTGEDVIQTQLGRIVAMAGDDEVRRGEAQQAGGYRWFLPGGSKNRFAIPLSMPLMLAATAMFFILLAVPVVFWMQSRTTPSREAMQALALAVTKERRNQPIIAGLPYSPYTATRGTVDRGDNLMFDRAANKVVDSSSVENRLVRAKILLARDIGGDPQQALELLNQESSTGKASADVWNDKGVAEFELGKYEEAIASFTVALELSPAFREALFNRALSEEARALNDAARADFQRFINTNPEVNWRQEAERRLAGLSGPSAPAR